MIGIKINKDEQTSIRLTYDLTTVEQNIKQLTRLYSIIFSHLPRWK